MTNQEYINEHPEKFKDDIDKWLFTEFNILGGCSSAQGSMEYSVARMVAEKMQRNTIEKACEEFCKINCYGNPPRSTCISLGTCMRYDDFRKAMEE